MENMAPGRGKLKVTGILYIILGVIACLGGLVVLIGGGLLMASGEQTGVALGAAAGVLSVLALVNAVLYLVVGILGVKNCGKPEKCGVNFVLGIVVLVLVAIGLVLNISISGISGAASSVIGLVLAILYLLGAKENKDAAAKG